MVRTVIEVLGKPKEHVENTFREYINKFKADPRYKIVNEEFAEARQQEGTEMWSTFAELEFKTEDIRNIITFCFDYMPSQIEILEPEEIKFSDVDMSEFMTDLQGKLHSVDMLAKSLKIENEHLQRNMSLLLKNYILVLLARGNMTSEHISKLTGVTKDKIEDFLDKMIDEKKVDLKEGIYFLVKENGKEN
jgi:hypothetical protein